VGPSSHVPARPPQIAVLCYLCDTTAETGALRILPGSHAASVPLHRILPEAHSDESAGLDPGNAAMTDQPDQITLALRAGDAVVTDYRLLHGTHANAGDRRRDCVLLSFTPHWNELPADTRGHLIRHPALPADHGYAAGHAGSAMESRAPCQVISVSPAASISAAQIAPPRSCEGRAGQSHGVVSAGPCHCV
jgi:hypothetical protein